MRMRLMQMYSQPIISKPFTMRTPLSEVWSSNMPPVSSNPTRTMPLPGSPALNVMWGMPSSSTQVFSTVAMPDGSIWMFCSVIS